MGDHLGQLHGCQSWAEPPVAGEDIHTGLDEPDGLNRDRRARAGRVGTAASQATWASPRPPRYLAKDLLCIRLQLSTQLHAGQVSLQKQVGLDVRVIELRVIQLVGDLLGQLESGRRRADDEEVTLPETYSQAAPIPGSQPFKTQRGGWVPGGVVGLRRVEVREGGRGRRGRCLPVVTGHRMLWARGPSFSSEEVLLKLRCPHLPQEVVFMVPDGNVLILSRIGDDHLVFDDSV